MQLCNLPAVLGAECRSLLTRTLLPSPAEGSGLLESIDGVLEAVTKVSSMAFEEPQQRPRVQSRL